MERCAFLLGMDIVITITVWIINFLSLPLPAGGFFVIVAILATWLINRSKFKSMKERARSLDLEIEDFKRNLDINRKVHEEGERALMKKNKKLHEELERVKSEARILQEKPSRREWARLKRCEKIVKRIALITPGDALGVADVFNEARSELVECSIESPPETMRCSFIRRLLPLER